MHNFSTFIEWAFMAILSGATIYGVRILSELNKSVDKLNITVAQLIVRHEWHDSQIEDLKRQFEQLRSGE